MSEVINIDNLESISVTGATKVVSATANQAVVETKQTCIIISGTNLEVKKLDLDNGVVSFAGNLSNIKFTNVGAGKQPFLKRIFR